MNDRLEVKGIGPISKSAFNRKAMRLSRRASQLEERRYIYAGIAEKLTPEEISKSDIVLGEFLKTLIDELLDGDGLNSKTPWNWHAPIRKPWLRNAILPNIAARPRKKPQPSWRRLSVMRPTLLRKQAARWMAKKSCA
ncbi:DUF3486 family protein [Ochrobactrum pseudogrignonense]|nr:DUF3486 family protein [Brucella pseudogrignonensis]